MNELALAVTMRCPMCLKSCDVSEHHFFHYDVIAVRCRACRLYTIVGADRWIRHPGVTFSTPEAYNEVQKAFSDLFDAMAKSVHEAKSKGCEHSYVTTAVDCSDPARMLQACRKCAHERVMMDGVEIDPATYVIPNTYNFDGPSGCLDVGTAPETWRDRPPLL